jgi:hypothetical protein
MEKNVLHGLLTLCSKHGVAWPCSSKQRICMRAPPRLPRPRCPCAARESKLHSNITNNAQNDEAFIVGELAPVRNVTAARGKPAMV